MVNIRLGRESDIQHIKNLADRNKDHLGFTTKPMLGVLIALKELHVAVSKEEIIGFISWHKRRDGWVTVYKLAVAENARRKGIGKKLMSAIANGPTKLKCHTLNPATKFYNSLGFKTVSTELTKGGKSLSVMHRQ